LSLDVRGASTSSGREKTGLTLCLRCYIRYDDGVSRMRHTFATFCCGLAALVFLPLSALADDAGGGEDTVRVYADPLEAKLDRMRAMGTSGVPAPLWHHVDPSLQERVNAEITRLGLDHAVRRKQLSLAVVDVTDEDHPRVAQVNGDVMMYAASLPKIAVLLATFEKISAGHIRLDAETQRSLEQMIRYSSNTAATRMIHTVGKEYIADVLMSPRYRLYDPTRNGGLWVGKDYASAGVWRRDPLHNLSHGATAMQVARFYYMLETGGLVSREHSRRMKNILGETKIPSKFAKGLYAARPRARMYRKSGTWRDYHSDSAIVEHDGRTYVAVGLTNSTSGADWLSRLIVAFDDAVRDTAGAPEASAAAPAHRGQAPVHRISRARWR